MEFALSSEQIMLQASAQRVLEREIPLERVREAARAHADPSSLWSALVELGAPAMLIAEEWGGAALDVLDAALISEVLGRFVAPAPFIAACVMAPLAIAGAGAPAQQQEHLPQIAAGARRFAVAVSEHASGARGKGVVNRNNTLSGEALFALDARAPNAFIVADAAGALFIVAADAPGLDVTPMPTIDATRAVAALRFTSTPCEALPHRNAETLARVIDAGRVMFAADSLGAASRMLENAVSYAGERIQFNRPIATFQSVKHMCAEMAAEIEPARALIWYGAYAFNASPEEAPRMVRHAKAHMSEIATFVARTATEVHGGMGFTDLLGLHFWFKRIGFNRQALGGPERLRAEIALLNGWCASARS